MSFQEFYGVYHPIAITTFVVFFLGVLYACQQKLKRRGKSHAKSKDVNTAHNNDVVTTAHKSNENGLRHRVVTNEKVVKDKSVFPVEMGTQQSKDTTERQTVPHETLVKNNATKNELTRTNSVISATLTKQDSKEQTIVITTQKPQKCDENVKSLNEPLMNDELLPSASTNIESNKKHSTSHHNSTTTPHVIDDVTSSKVTNMHDQQNEQSKTSSFSPQQANSKTVTQHNNSMPSCKTETTATKPQEEGEDEGVQVLTLEEKTIVEEYDDGTKVTRTIFSEIANNKTPLVNDSDASHQLANKNQKQQRTDSELNDIVLEFDEPKQVNEISQSTDISKEVIESKQIDDTSNSKNISEEVVIDDIKSSNELLDFMPSKTTTAQTDIHTNTPVLNHVEHTGSLNDMAENLSHHLIISSVDQVKEVKSDHDQEQLLCKQAEQNNKRKRHLSDFRLFVFNKYAEKMIKSILNLSYNESAVLRCKDNRNVSSNYANMLVDDIISDMNGICANVQKGKKFPSRDQKISHKDNKKTIENTTTKNTVDDFAEQVTSSIFRDKLYDDIKKVNKRQNYAKTKPHKIDELSSTILNGVLDDLEDGIVEASTPTSLTPNIVINNALNKPLTLTLTDGQLNTETENFIDTRRGSDDEATLDNVASTSDRRQVLTGQPITLKLTNGQLNMETDNNQNLVVLRKPKTVASDRPLSGFAEKLAELLAEEDDELDFFDSDEDLSESLEKIKSTYGPKRRISVEVINFQKQFSIDEINDVSTKSIKSKVSVKRKDRGNRFKAKGDRPMSLYAQDMLADILADEEELAMFSSDEDEFNDDDEKEEEQDPQLIDDEEILPVKETAVLLENVIPFAPVHRTFSIGNEYELALDDVMRSRRISSIMSPTSGKIPELRQAVVVDAGCGVLKAGLCGETEPTCYCPSVIGIPRRFSQDASKMKKSFYVGDEAWSMAGMLQIEHPIKQDITSWSDVENMMEYLLDEELSVHDNEHPVLLTELALTKGKNREKLTELMFEKFGVPAYYLANQAALSMYSMGYTSGLCLTSGFYTTQAVPIYEGHALPYATVQLDIGGDHVTNHLGRAILGTQGMSFSTSSEKLVLNAMKQSHCYVATNAATEQEKYKTNIDMQRNYTLPDGQEITLGAEMCIATEILFDPELMGLHQPSTSECVIQSLKTVNPDISQLLADNVLVTGGNTKLHGYGSRLEQELLREILKGGQEITINYADDPILSTWIGGSVLSSISTFRDQWITLDQYAEQGSHIIHTYCF